jgi:large subunit ribosomal protein L9
MKIILQENVDKLGTRGAVVDVKDGYARNYLLPRKMAVPATAGNLKALERMRSTFAKREAEEREGAVQLAQAIGALSVTIRRKTGENDQLFGSVTAADIAEAIAAHGHSIDKRRVQLHEPLKTLGERDVVVRLHHDVNATVKVTVAREE